MASQPERQPRRRHIPESNGEKGPEYPQSRRILVVIDILVKHGPQSAQELSKKIGLTYRSTARFMNSLQAAGWPFYVRKDNASAKASWTIDEDKVMERFIPGKRK